VATTVANYGDRPMSTSKHALDAAARVGSVEIRVHAELLCPCCNRRIRPFRCPVDVITAKDAV
jgi:hypothetical protein